MLCTIVDININIRVTHMMKLMGDNYMHRGEIYA